MNERELRAVAEEIEKVHTDWQAKTTKLSPQEYLLEWFPSSNKMAQAAISASDSQYVKGLVGALRYYQELDDRLKNFTNGFADKPRIDESSVARLALQQLPEDLRQWQT